MRDKILEIMNRQPLVIGPAEQDIILNSFEEEKRSEVQQIFIEATRNPFVIDLFWKKLIVKWQEDYSINSIIDKNGNFIKFV